MRHNAAGRWATRLVAITSMVIAAGWATPASAQETGIPVGADYLPTRAGTEIVNVATASFTDANGNLYAEVDATVTVVVDLVPNIQVMALDEDANVTPGGEYTYYFQITNLTNDNASPVLTLDFDPLFVEVQEYCFTVYNVDGSVKTAEECYTDEALFLAAVNATDLDIHEYIVFSVTVVVLEGGGGQNTDIVAEVPTVVVDNADYDNTGNDYIDDVTLIVGDVDVTAAEANVEQLPSNLTEYSATFTVTNSQAVTADYDLVAALFGTNDAAIAILRIELCSTAGVPITDIQLAAGDSAEICVFYTVGDVDAGLTSTIELTATDQVLGFVTDTDSTTVTVIRPALTISKKAYRDDAGSFDGTSEILDMGLVVPGEYFWYEIVVENVGTAEAVTVAIEDDLDLTYLNFLSQTDDLGAAPAWTYTGQDTLLGQIRAQLATLSTADGPRFIRIRVQVK